MPVGRLVGVAFAAGLVVGTGATVLATWRYGLLLGWVAAALVFTTRMWFTIWPLDAASTRRHAERDDPRRALADMIILVGAVASLGGVALLLLGGTALGGSKDEQAALSVASVALSWLCVHTVFTTRYARLYYGDGRGGVDFNESAPPAYSDFAYLAFTVGMTFQVSDTELADNLIRRTVLRHALLSYVLGAVVIATTINLVAGLGK